jgi:hypothetical protein
LPAWSRDALARQPRIPASLASNRVRRRPDAVPVLQTAAWQKCPVRCESLIKSVPIPGSNRGAERRAGGDGGRSDGAPAGAFCLKNGLFLYTTVGRLGAEFVIHLEVL